MLGTILEAARGGETGGYGVRRIYRYGEPEEGGSEQESSYIGGS